MITYLTTSSNDRLAQSLTYDKSLEVGSSVSMMTYSGWLCRFNFCDKYYSLHDSIYRIIDPKISPSVR